MSSSTTKSSSERAGPSELTDGPTIVGISAMHHDAAACVVRGSKVLVAAEEERFTRRKHDGGVPVHAFRSCLADTGLTIDEIDVVAVGFDPAALAARRAAFGQGGRPTLDEAALRSALGVEAPIVFVPHHVAHAASAFHYSTFADAAVLVVDGVGEWATTSIAIGRGLELDEVESIVFPHSLGLFYAAVTEWLGFRVNHDEYKVMGLAAWTEPGRGDEMAAVVPDVDDGRFELDLDYFDFLAGDRMYSDRFVVAFGAARAPGGPIERRHVEVAASAQAVLEDRVLALARRARDVTGRQRLCVAGGVMLNAVVNGRLSASGVFDEIWFQPVAGDAGTALGAAASVLASVGIRAEPLVDLRLGPAVAPGESPEIVAATPGTSVDFRTDQEGLVNAVADLVAAGAIVGWFHGRMELGPRALGARSLLADPRSPATRDRINAIVKERESWRPLAPMVGDWAVADHFVTDHPLPFMIEAVPAVDPEALGATTHVDGTARPQSVDPAEMALVANLLRAVERRIGVPVVVNTSFNHASEPIVATPAEALTSGVRLGLDAAVIDAMLVTDLPTDAAPLVAAWQQPAPVRPRDNLYPL